jgi:hypothetical protein
MASDPLVDFVETLPAADASAWAPAVYLVAVIAVQYLCVRSYSRNTGGRFATLYAGGGLGRLFVHLFKAPATALHELSHAVMCRVTGTPLGKVVLWRPRITEDGNVIFGYVEHAPRRDWRGALVALAPGLVIPPVLALLSYALMGDALPGADDVASRPVWVTAIWIVALLVLTTSAFPSSGDFELMSFLQWVSTGAFVGAVVFAAVAIGGWAVVIGALASIVQLLVPVTAVSLVYYAISR